MAEGRKGSLIRLVVLVVVLAAAGGYFVFQQSKPPKGGNLDRIVNEDSAGLIGGSLDAVKSAFHHPSPEKGAEEGVWLFDFSKVDPTNSAKIEVVVRGGKVASMREFDDRVPPPKPALKGEPDASDASTTPPPSGEAPAPTPTGGG